MNGQQYRISLSKMKKIVNGNIGLNVESFPLTDEDRKKIMNFPFNSIAIKTKNVLFLFPMAKISHYLLLNNESDKHKFFK